MCLLNAPHAQAPSSGSIQCTSGLPQAYAMVAESSSAGIITQGSPYYHYAATNSSSCASQFVVRPLPVSSCSCCGLQASTPVCPGPHPDRCTLYPHCTHKPVMCLQQTRKWNVSASGETVTASQTIQVKDTTAPVIQGNSIAGLTAPPLLQQTFVALSCPAHPFVSGMSHQLSPRGAGCRYPRQPASQVRGCHPRLCLLDHDRRRQLRPQGPLRLPGPGRARRLW
jgi:hypothetical protein